MVRKIFRFATLCACVLAAACGEAPPAEPDPVKLEQLIASMEAADAAEGMETVAAGIPLSKEDAEKAAETEAVVKTIEKARPDRIPVLALESYLLKKAG